MFRSKLPAAALAAGLLAALPTVVLAASEPDPGLYHIVLHGRPVWAGDHVFIRVKPEPPPGVLETIQVTTAGGRTMSLVGPYRAPYVIEAGTPPVEVVAVLTGEGWRREARTQLELIPGNLVGTDDCLGAGQTFVPEYGDIAGTAGELSDLPPLLRPAGARVPGFTGTIVVRTLVCRSGRVLDALVPPSESDPRVRSAGRNPAVVAAAEAAARKSFFGRGRVAAWIEVPIVFGP